MTKVFIASSPEANYPTFAFQCKKAFTDLGCETIYFNYRKYKLNKFNFTNKILNKALLSAVLEENPDFLFVTKGESIEPKIIEKISKKGIKTINWTLDEPFGKIYKNNKIKNINEYDYFFVFDPYYLKELKEINKNSYYLPCAADPENVHKEVIKLNERSYKYDVSFLGSYQPERENLFNSITESKVNIFGHSWDRVNWNNVKNKDNLILKNKPLIGKEMCEFFNLSKINLNLQALHGIESMNLRTFEVPATNSFLLTDFKKELPNLLKINKEVVAYKDTKELNEKIKYYLENKEERDKITLAGHKRVVKDHSIKNRIKEIINIVRK